MTHHAKMTIYNVYTLETVIWSEIWNFVFLTRKVFNSNNFSIASYKKRNAQSTFEEKPQMKLNCWKKQKHGYPTDTWSYKSFKGTVVNQRLPSLHGGSWEITLTYTGCPNKHGNSVSSLLRICIVIPNVKRHNINMSALEFILWKL